jgi:uncharacterized RDD family membrane protein YckC
MADHAAAAAPAGGDRAFDDLRAPSLYRRMACWLYEGMLLFGVYFAATAVFSLFAPVRRNDELHGLLQAFLFIVCGLYFAWCWSRGQTLAMKTWRIAMVDAQGRRVSQPRALWRYVLSWIWVLPPLALTGAMKLSLAELGVLLLGWVWIWALLARFHRQRQFWHDQWAGTRLVDVAPRATKGVPA